MTSTEEQLRAQIEGQQGTLRKLTIEYADLFLALQKAAEIIKPFADGLIGLRDLTAAKEWMREHGNV